MGVAHDDWRNDPDLAPTGRWDVAITGVIFFGVILALLGWLIWWAVTTPY